MQLFERSGGGWAPTERLVASDFAAASAFGQSLAFDGQRLVVGAPEADAGGVSNAGAVYVFERIGGAFLETARLVAADPGVEDRLGSAVDVDGERIAAGAAQDQVGNANFAGSVDLFELGPGGWSEVARLVASDGQAIDLFGHSLALDGDDLLVGAYVHDASAGADAGTVYAFERVGGAWLETSRLEASDGVAQDRFGYSLALESGRALVGAHFHAHGGPPRSGAAYVFEKGAGGWSETAELRSSDPQAEAQFGWAVALWGDRALVGAPFRDVLARPDAGRAEAFSFAGGSWSPAGTDVASMPEDAGRLGWSVTAGPWGACVASIAGDAPGAADAGTVLVFGEPPCVETTCGCPAGVPCGNPDPAAGCQNSAGAGALLVASSGSASIAAADLVLGVSGALPAQPGLLFQGAVLLGGGAGLPFGDGLRCVGAQVVRLEVLFPDAGANRTRACRWPPRAVCCRGTPAAIRSGTAIRTARPAAAGST